MMKIRITFIRHLVLLFAATFLGLVQAAPVFPVKYGANSRYLVDQNNVPFPILGRTSWFITSLSVADYQTFIDDTAARGHNSIELHVLSHDPRGNRPPFGGNGDRPFLNRLNGTAWNGALTYGTINNEAPDFTTPNEPFWSLVDGLLAYCETKGILVFMFPAYVGYAGGEQGWMQELVANGPTKIQTYGAWIATRYKNQKNLVWMMGGDMGTGSHPFDTAQTSVENALLTGLKSVSGQQSIYFSAEWDSQSIATDQTSFGTSMTLNGAYSWTGDINYQGRRAYAYSPARPAFVLEEPYDEEGPDGNSYNPSAIQPVRRFQWWGWLSTIGGFISGNGYVWPCNTSVWINHLNTQGSRDMTRLNAFIGSIAWYDLVPSGLNGMRTLVTAGGSSVSAADYVAAAATPDGTLLVAYIPPAHSGAITVDMAAMSGLARARWFDPTSAIYTDIGTGLANTGTRSFTPTGNNSVGQQDWVLVLDRASGSAAPTISDIPNQSTPTNTPTAAIAFTIGDTDTPVASLTLGKSSSNPTLVPTNNIVFGGSGTNRTVTLNPANNQTGSATITVSVSDGTNTTSDTFVLTVNAAAAFAVVRVNAGGGSFTDSAGNAWSADTGFNTGNANTVSTPINNTVDDALYQTERWDASTSPELAYSFNLPNGNYLVNLHFAEIYSGTFGVGKRVFDVLIEGRLRIDNLDIYSQAGANTALIISLPVTISDGQLNLAFVHGVENPKLSAIEVFATSAASATPTISDIANQSTTVNTPTAAIPFTIGDTDTAVASLTLGNGSSNPTLVPTNNMVFGGSGSNRTVTVTPATGLTGAATLTVSVSDGTNSASDTFVLTVNSVAVTNAPTTNTVPQWERFETALTNTIVHADPYRDVTLNVTYTRPDASTVSFWGFYDGGSTWRMRFMPDQLGTWSYSASFSDGAPGGTGIIQCVAGNLPGMISRDETNSLWFGYKGGGHAQLRSFQVGDRYFASNWPASNRTAFLDWAQAQGYNMLSIASLYLNRNVAGRGQGWNTPDLWDGTARTLKAAEYQKLEALLDDLAARKMIVFPFAGFFGKSSDFPLIQADQELYLRYTLARVGSYWNVVFAVAGPEPLYATDTIEYRNAMPFAELTRLGALIKSLDVFGHPLTVHNVTAENAFVNEPWESFTTLQGPKTLSRTALSSGLLAAHSARPLFAAELLWPGNTLGHPVYSDTDIRKNGFVITMSAATLNFGDMNGNSSSGFSGSLDPVDKIQSRHDIIKRVWDFFEPFQLYRMSPHQDLVNNGFCLADPGREYLVYLESRGTVNVAVSNGPFQVEWINAQNTLDRRTAPATSTGQGLASPTDGDDWLLHLVSTAVAGAAPTISDILNQSTTVNTPTPAIPFTIGDAQTPAGSLTLGKGTSNPALVSTNGIVFGGSGANRTVTVTPVTGQTGAATITVSVSDGTNSASDTFALTVAAVATGAKAFTNSAAITIPNQGAAAPYPSVINVAGLGSATTNVTITLRNLTHAWSRDVDVLLVGPGGQKVMLMSDAGSGAANNVTLTLSDGAASALPTTSLVSGIFRPANYTDASSGGDNFPSPAPAAPYGSTLSGFNGQPANGTWSLYVFDDGPGDLGSFAGGWSIALSTTNAVASASVPPSPLQITSVTLDAAGIVQVTASGEAGFTYALEASSDLAGWIQVDLQNNTSGSVVFTEQPTTNSIRFYRVMSMPQ